MALQARGFVPQIALLLDINYEFTFTFYDIIETTLRRERCETLMETIIDSANYLFDVDNLASQRLQ